MKPKNEERRRRRRLHDQMLRAERRRNFGRHFWNLTLQAARVADDDSPSSNIFCATFFSRHNTSIPDQQYRSLRLCHALCEAGIVDRNKTVAIVGAGISGMTCAVALAVRTDCLVHVYESDNVLLRRLWEAPFRYLHPNLNTWAATSPINRYDPHTRTLFPIMNWSGNYAPFVAEELIRQFRHYRHCLGIALRLGERVFDVFERNGKPMVLLDTNSIQVAFHELRLKRLKELEELKEFEELPLKEFKQRVSELIDRKPVIRTLRKTHAYKAIEYDVVIVATGFGEERRPVDDRRKTPLATDYSYWRSGDPDFYRVPGRIKKSLRKRVLISGNGDSAIIELAHYLIHDFAHRQIFEFLPLTDISSGLWFDFCGMVNGLHYRHIEAGNPERYRLAGPISWYWTQRASGSSLTRPTKRTKRRTSNAVSENERKIYGTIHRALAEKGIGEELSGDVVNKIERDVDDDLSALASYEVEKGINSVFSKEYYAQHVVKPKFTTEFTLMIVGPTPTIYSRRQSPMTWYLIRMLREFARRKFTYEKGRLLSTKFVDGVVVAEIDTMQAPLPFDAIVARQGPDYGTGLVRQLRPAESAVSKYAVAGNPIPGDDIQFADGFFLFGNENWSKSGYLYFLHTYFQTRLWKRVIKRGVSLQDQQDSDEADLIATRIQWGGAAQDRAKAEMLFRRFKAAESRRARMRAQDSLRRLDDDVTIRRSETLADLMIQNKNNGTRSDELRKLAIERVRES